MAQADEAVSLRAALGPEPEIYNFSGFMQGDDEAITSHGMIPVLNSAEQVKAFAKVHAGHPSGIQLDTGMNRLGMETLEAASVAQDIAALLPDLIMSHLACADEPLHPMNAAQLAAFNAMSFAPPAPATLSAAMASMCL